MRKKYKMIRKKLALGAMVLTCMITVGAFTGCSIKDKASANTSEVSQGNKNDETYNNSAKTDGENADVKATEETNPGEETKATEETNPSEETKPTEETNSGEETKAAQESKTAEEANSVDTKKAEEKANTDKATNSDQFQEYINLIGQKKEDLKSIYKEEPKIIDEGGLEFDTAQIRIWLDDKGLVNQVFTMNQAVDFNGVKIGDDIKTFKKVFGDPFSDKNGDAHFKYGNVYLSVNYDSKTGETYAVYILKENF